MSGRRHGVEGYEDIKPMPSISEEPDDAESGSESPQSSAGVMQLSRDYYETDVGQASPSRGGTSNESAAEMRLSRDNYPLEMAGQASRPDEGTSGESAAEMMLSRDNYALELPAQAEPSVRPKVRQRESPVNIPATSPKWKPRQVLKRPAGAGSTDSDELQFKWDHFGRVFTPAADMPGLEWIFNEDDDRLNDTISDNILEDLDQLAEVGYNIEYPYGLLGEGFFGAVYRGSYGPQAKELKVLPEDTRFAVKIVEFGTKSDEVTRDRRERFETEKYIMTNVYHKNIVPIRMIINMGIHRSFPFVDNPVQRYVSPERVYLIMDFADEGELQWYLDRQSGLLQTYFKVNFIRDLFAGMLYLHSNDIVHGDVHTGNVLLFKEGEEIVAKWTDFGLGYVGSDKQYKYKMVHGEDMARKYKRDFENMALVFRAILREPFRVDRPPEERQILQSLDDMTKMLKTTTNLLEVYERFKHVLEDELDFEEQHY